MKRNDKINDDLILEVNYTLTLTADVLHVIYYILRITYYI